MSFKQYSNDRTQCLICGTNKTIYCFHSTHYFCVYCLSNFIIFNSKIENILKIDESNIKSIAQNLICPIPNCSLLKQTDEIVIILDKIINYYKPKVGLEASIKEITCQLCLEKFNIDNLKLISLMNCSDFICKECFDQYISTKKNEGFGIKEILCPICQVSIDYQQLQNYVSKEILNALNERQIFIDNPRLVTCPSNDCKFVFEIPPEERHRSISCPQCKKSFCRGCSEIPHEQECILRKSLIEEAKKQSQIITPCPYCLNVSEKMDDKCDHVKCAYCLNDFCMACGAKRHPIMIHGNQYHRPECKHYREFNGTDQIEEKCAECKALKKACNRPLNLENGDIPKQERPYD